MKFKSFPGKRVWTGLKEITFGDKPYETTDKDEIAALRRAVEVTEVGGDGTDGSGNKVKLSREQLDVGESPESDNLYVSPNTSDAEQLQHLVHEANAQDIVLAPTLPGHEPKEAADFVAEHIGDRAETESAVVPGSTAAVDAAEQDAKDLNHGALSTEEANESKEVASEKPAKKHK